jgi:hypothetical protein
MARKLSITASKGAAQELLVAKAPLLQIKSQSSPSGRQTVSN